MVSHAMNTLAPERRRLPCPPLASGRKPARLGRRFLFQVRNRRGLGHMMRGLNIARELAALDPQAEILFYLRTPPAEGFWPASVRYVVDPDPDALRHWPEVLADFAPDVVVYDTMLPAAAEPVTAGAKCAYIMRKCLAEEQQQVFRHPFLERVELILVPHSEAQFAYPLPAAIAGRTRFVGPIVRRPDAAAQAALCAKYGLKRGDFLLTSTVGGGGFEAQADAFFAAVLHAHRRLHGRLPGLRHIVVQGPNYGKRLAPLPGMTLVDFEPEMINLLAISNLVVAEGGYNTVNEIAITRTPAIFLPSARGKDDQFERVQALAERGLARVIGDADGEALAEHIAALFVFSSELAAMRARYAGDAGEIGNRRAAQALLELVA